MVPLLDTHQHLLYPERMRYAWAEKTPALEGRAYRLEDYQGLTEGAGVAATIFMESDAADYRAEARMVAELAKAPESRLLGLVASCRPETDEGFESWLDEGEALGVVGYRRILHETDDEVPRSGIFRANVRRIGARGLPFDMCFLARQLPIALELARACPDTRLVLDHCGVPDIAGGGFQGWRDGVSALAAMPNVGAKLSGVFAYCAPGRATLAEVKPYVEHVIAAFGPERCLWGSDWPVVDTRADLPGWIAAFRTILAGYSEAEAAAMAHGTAARVYGVALPEVSAATQAR
jgi:predicted TIM-barrel fold metal-dependent hydrolase